MMNRYFLITGLFTAACFSSPLSFAQGSPVSPVSAAQVPAAISPPAAASDDPLAWGGAAAVPAKPAGMPAEIPQPPQAQPVDSTPAAIQMPAAVPAEEKNSAAVAPAPVVEPAPAVMEKKPDEAKEEIKNPSVPAIDPSRIDALEKRMTALEGAVDKLQHEKETVQPVVEKAQPRRKKTVHKDKPHVTAVPKGWILKSAQPGQAIVEDKDTHELQTIVVGDTIPGLGKVTAIGKDESGHWAVNGSTGKVTH